VFNKKQELLDVLLDKIFANIEQFLTDIRSSDISRVSGLIVALDYCQCLEAARLSKKERVKVLQRARTMRERMESQSMFVADEDKLVWEALSLIVDRIGRV
jgi:hypothetical protein